MTVDDRCDKCKAESNLNMDGVCVDCIRKHNHQLTVRIKVAKQKLKNAEVELLLAEGYLENYLPYFSRAKNIRKRIQILIKLMDGTIKHQNKLEKNDEERKKAM